MVVASFLAKVSTSDSGIAPSIMLGVRTMICCIKDSKLRPCSPPHEDAAVDNLLDVDEVESVLK